MAIRKYYLLMLLGMAANMLVVNDVRAMKKMNTDENQKILNDMSKKGGKTFIEEYINLSPCKYIGFFLQWKNTFNLLGGALFTLANSHFNFYKYKESFYFDWWCGGWNSGRFANGHLQFCPNINFARGLIEVIMFKVQIFLLDIYRDEITNKVNNKYNKRKRKEFIDIESMTRKSLFSYMDYTPLILASKLKCNLVGIFIVLLQDSLSIPLIIHFTSNFSISIAFDSIIWMVVTHFVNNGQFEETIKNANNTINKIMAS